MRLKKGMTLIAIGFLFVSFRFSFNIRGSVLSLPPEFVGWILFVLAYPKIVKYTSFRISLYWIPLVLAVYSALNWVLSLIHLTLLFPLVMIAAGTLGLVYLIKLLGCMERFARDYARHLVSQVRTLKLLYLALQLVLIVLTAALTVNPFLWFVSILNLIAALAIAVTSIVICITLFQLREAVPKEAPRLTGDPPGGDGFGSAGTQAFFS